MILICGATGTIGSALTRSLVAANIPVRALLRDPAIHGSRLPAGVQGVAGDLAQKETLAPALDGVNKAFLLSAIGSQQREMERNFVTAATQAGVAHIVKLSVMRAGVDASFSFGRIHGEIEKLLDRSGIGWTHLRPNMLMQNLRWYREALSNGILPMPLGNAAVSHVDADDVAAVAHRVLIDERHVSQTYTLTGPEALTCNEAASVLSSSLGREIRYAPVSMSQFRDFLTKNGESDLVVDAECNLFELWSHGAGAEVTGTVEQITSRKPKSLATFAKEHAKELN
jgi:uncharacterized protein YbjT (DUF2867 family)